MNLDNQLAEVRQKEAEILHQIDEKNKRKMIPCECCKKNHSIYKLTAIQTHWYVPPSGCTDGAYWEQGEMQFICPITQIRNRIIFDNYDVEWHLRQKYEFNPAMQFQIKFKKFFKEVIDKYDDHYSFVNNYYVDQNRKKFGLVERKNKNG